MKDLDRLFQMIRNAKVEHIKECPDCTEEELEGVEPEGRMMLIQLPKSLWEIMEDFAKETHQELNDSLSAMLIMDYLESKKKAEVTRKLSEALGISRSKVKLVNISELPDPQEIEELIGKMLGEGDPDGEKTVH